MPHSPRVLLGLANDVHWSLREFAVERYLPNTDAKLGEAAELRKLAAKYPDAARRMAASFYNSGMADKYVRTRVEV